MKIIMRGSVLAVAGMYGACLYNPDLTADSSVATASSSSNAAAETGSTPTSLPELTATGAPSTTVADESGGLKIDTDDTTSTPTAVGTSESSESVDPDFIGAPDAGVGKECDVWLQDCPQDQKCVPWAAGGQEMFDAAKCSPISGKREEGESCVVEGGGYSGLDNCGAGLLCWHVNSENEGLCVSMCKGKREAPVCGTGQLCDQIQDGLLILCQESCDPLAGDCPYRMQLCSANAAEEFICIMDENGNAGGYGDPCNNDGECNSGLWCAPPGFVPGCAAENGCCSEFCNIYSANECAGAPEQQCVAWYDMPPLDKDHIGGCRKQ